MKTTRTLLLTVLAMAFLATGALAQDRGKDKDSEREARPTHRVLGIDAHPFAALTLSRPSGPDRWSTGFEAGVEIDFEPVWFGVQYTLHDILTEEEDETYPWDGTLDFKLGIYY